MAHGPGSAPHVTWLTRLFDKKVASDKDNKYDGHSGGERWHEKTGKFFIGECPDCELLLPWAQQKGKVPISKEMITVETQGWPLETDPNIISANMWSYFNLNLEGEAAEFFKAVPHRNGLEAWRMLTDHIGKTATPESRSEIRARLRVIHPMKADLSNVEIVLERWERDLRELASAAGEVKSDEEKKDTLISMLPKDFREAMIWKSSDFPSYFELRTHVLTKMREIRKTRGQSTTHLLDEIANDEDIMALDDSEEMIAIVQMLADGGCQQGEIMALAKKFYNRRKPQQKGSWQRPNQTQAPSRPPAGAAGGARTMRCGNCGEKDHTSAECKKPRIEVRDRKCWNCGQTGHMSSKCPKLKQEGGRSNINGLDGQDGAHYAFCLENDDGFTRVRRGVKTKPTPQAVTMGDMIDVAFNKYALLNEEIKEKVIRAPRKRLPARFCSIGLSAGRDILHAESQGNSFCLDACCSAKQCKIENEDTHDKEFETKKPQDRRELAAEMPPTVAGLGHVSRGSQDRLELAAEMPPIACGTPGSSPNPHATAAGHPNAFGPESGAGWFLPTDEPTKAKLSGGECQDELAELVLMPLELDEDDVLVAGEEEIEIVVAYDTAAVDNVCSKEDLPGLQVVPSNGSKQGRGFVAANGQRIDNEGEIHVVMEPSGMRNSVGTTFQIAEVSRPLLSASRVADAGYEAHVNALVATISRDGKPVAKFHRKGGLYLATMKVRRPKSPGNAAEAHFTGQGVKR